MRHGWTGLQISAARDGTATAIDDLTLELLRYGKGAGRFFAAAEADPGCAIAASLAGALHLFTMTGDGARKAAPFLAQAQLHAGGASARERLFVGAVADWAAGRMDAAIGRHLAILERWPTDLLSLKLATYHQLNQGDFPGMLRTIRSVLPANRRNSYVHGMHAFALSQMGRYREAEKVGRQAVEAAPDPWAQHAVAHVLDVSGAAEEGIAFMRQHASGWEDCSSFLYTHNWWHAALFHLTLGDHGGALALFDDRVWTQRKDYCQDQINAVSLLARLELAGVDVKQRWYDIAERLSARSNDHVNGFLDLHYVLALARAGRAEVLGDMVRSLTELIGGEAAPNDTHLMAVKGMAAYGSGDFPAAARLLLPVRDRLILLGGSDVQREIFDLILIHSLRRSHGHAAADRLENSRRGRRAEAAWQRRAVAATCAPEPPLAAAAL